MLRKLRGWDDYLSGGNVVVWEEDYLQEVTDLWIRIDFVLNCSNELDYGFGSVVTRCCFATNHNNSWDEIFDSIALWGVQYLNVSVNDIEDVHHLSFILMYSLDLDVIHRIYWDVKASVCFNPLF